MGFPVPVQRTQSSIMATQNATKGTRGMLLWNDMTGFWEPFCASYFCNSNGMNSDKLDAANTNLQALHSDNITVNSNLSTLHTDISTTNSSLTAVNTNLSTIHSDLQTLHTDLSSVNANLASIISALATTNSTLAAIYTTDTPTPASAYNATLTLAGTNTIRTGSGFVYAASGTGLLNILDNGTIIFSLPIAGAIAFSRPLPYSTKLQVQTIGIGVQVSVQYK